MQKPSVGRIVHYFDAPDAEPHAAIVTRVHSDTRVDLHVFWEMTYARRARVHQAEYDPEHRLGWDWPPRV